MEVFGWRIYLAMLICIYLRDDSGTYRLNQFNQYLEGLRRQKIIPGFRGYQILANSTALGISVADLRNATAVLLLVSQKLINSLYCRDGSELKLIIDICTENGIPFIPVILDGADRTCTPFSEIAQISEDGSVLALVNRLGTFNEAYKKIILEIKSRLCDRRIKQLTKQIETLTEELKELKAQIKCLEEQLKQLTRENEYLKIENSQLRQQLINETAQLRQEIIRLRQEIAQLTAEIAKLKTQVEQINSLIEENKRLREENKWLWVFGTIGWLAALSAFAWVLFKPQPPCNCPPCPNCKDPNSSTNLHTNSSQSTYLNLCNKTSKQTLKATFLVKSDMKGDNKKIAPGGCAEVLGGRNYSGIVYIYAEDINNSRFTWGSRNLMFIDEDNNSGLIGFSDQKSCGKNCKRMKMIAVPVSPGRNYWNFWEKIITW